MKHSTSETGAWTTRRFLALLGTVLLWIIAAIDLWFLWPVGLGGATSFVVVSGSSMEPTYYSGDLVIARDIEPSVGDVIVYAPESLGGSQIVHRIIGGNGEDGWVLQGDNNSFIDPFEPTAEEVRGVVLVHYAEVGRITALMLNPILWAAVLLAAMVMLVWFSGDDCDDDDDESDDEAAEPVDAPDDSAEPKPSKLSRAGPAIRVTALLAVATSVFAAGFSPAAAASMTVTRADEVKPYVLNACANPSPTWNSTTTATGTTSTQLTMPSIPAACLNRPFTISLRNSAGTQIAALTGTPTTSSYAFTMPSGNYTVAQVTTVIVKVDGWLFAIPWTPPTPPAPAVSCVALNPGGQVNTGYPCTVTLTPNGSAPWGYDNGTMLWNYTMSVNWTTTPPNSSWKWRVTINHAQPPFPGFTPQWVGLYSNPGLTLAAGYSCTQRPILILDSTSRDVWGATLEVANGPAPSWFSGQSLCS